MLSITSWHLRRAEKCELMATKTADAECRARYEAEAKLWRGFAEHLAAPDEQRGG